MIISKEQIAHFKTLKTPFYFYDMQLLEKTLSFAQTEAKKYGYILHYAMKANVNDKVLAAIHKHGYGADCVSGNEVQKAIDAGFPADEVVFAGVGKSDDEILTALSHDIFCFNCESVQEIEVINELAAQEGKIAKIAIRINPNVSANTHAHISTGLKENKFGVNMSEMDSVLEVIAASANIKLVGIHFHIGSQITDLSSYKNLCVRVNQIQEWFASRHVSLEFLNVGGGLGIDYYNPETNDIADFKEYFSIFNEFLKLQPGQKLHFELGRSMVAQCSSLITRVLYVKEGATTSFLILDAGMTELIRPMLYQAYHKINNLTTTSKEIETYDVVGPICESTDTFAKALELPKSKRKDIIEIKSAGAYGEVMASNYNLKTLHPAVYSDEVGVVV
ncbi:MAG: diaminopimelate decarboxylase [Bacteroidetes bacterium]|nr:diaminopimelate decarboxylase [Bacteroidota bacterium]